jgi:transcriptional regulator with XRE-family HTH domain
MRRHIERGVSSARAWREYLGLSQEEVAGRMGISQAALSQIENAKRPRRETLERLSAALGITLDQIPF